MSDSITPLGTFHEERARQMRPPRRHKRTNLAEFLSWCPGDVAVVIHTFLAAKDLIRSSATCREFRDAAARASVRIFTEAFGKEPPPGLSLTRLFAFVDQVRAGRVPPSRGRRQLRWRAPCDEEPGTPVRLLCGCATMLRCVIRVVALRGARESQARHGAAD